MISIYGVVVIWTTKHRGDRTHFWFRLAWRWLLRVACTKLIRGCTDASHKPSTSTSSRLPSAWRLLPLPPTSTCHHRQCCSLPSTLNRQRVVSLKLIHPYPPPPSSMPSPAPSAFCGFTETNISMIMSMSSTQARLISITRTSPTSSVMLPWLQLPLPLVPTKRKSWKSEAPSFKPKPSLAPWIGESLRCHIHIPSTKSSKSTAT